MVHSVNRLQCFVRPNTPLLNQPVKHILRCAHTPLFSWFHDQQIERFSYCNALSRHSICLLSPPQYHRRFNPMSEMAKLTPSSCIHHHFPFIISKHFAGATNGTYTVADVQSNINTGNYVVVISNAFDVLTSAVATLSDIHVAPSFVYVPISQSVVEGDMVAFSAKAIGTEPIAYQWQVWSNGSLVDLPGQTNSQWVDANMQYGDGGTYAIVASNASGETQYTNAVLTDVSCDGDESCPNNGAVMPVFGPRQDYTFQANITYYIFSGTPFITGDFYLPVSTNNVVDLYGTTTIQGGAVIKFDYDEWSQETNAISSIASLVLHGPLVCDTDPYKPAILTSIDDDSQGMQAWVWWFGYYDVSSGSPATAANGCAYLNLDDVHDTNGTSLNYLRFCYADQAVTTPTNSGILDIWNCQFVMCNRALNSWAKNSPTTNRLHNALFSHCGYAIGCQTNLSEVDGEQVTADVSSFWDPGPAAWKSLSHKLYCNRRFWWWTDYFQLVCHY